MVSHSTPAPLQGRTIVVIGGTSGLGLSATKAFVAAGARAFAMGPDEEGVRSAAAELGDAVHFVCDDATNPRAVETLITTSVQTAGQLDGLYHVAGGSGRKWGDGPLHELSDEGWRATFDLNLSSVFYSNRAAVRQFLKQKSGGSIVNLSSVLAWSPSPAFFTTHAYAAAKSAIIGLSRACAALYAAQDIRFNVIAPGLIATPMSRRAQESEEILNFIRSKQPLDGGRIGSPADVDAAAVFFMSDASRFVTGQVLAVDGGWTVTEGQVAKIPSH